MHKYDVNFLWEVPLTEKIEICIMYEKYYVLLRIRNIILRLEGGI